MESMVQSQYDVHVLVDAYSDSLDILDEILSIFLEETPQRIDSLKEAAEAKDYSSVHRIAHGLANTTGTLKADHALKTSREIERLAREEQDEGMMPLVERLEAEVGQVIDQIEEYKARA
jgi:HPt (histidine-containing phosphotransfer) domain-containing protein